MNKRESQKAETIADILNVSEKLFHEKGFEKTSIMDIATGCGLSKGALYHHFKSKEEVLEKICSNHYHLLRDTFLPIVNQTELSMKTKIKQIMTIARNSQMNTAAASFSQGDSAQPRGIRNAALSQLLNSYSKMVYLDVFVPLFAEGKRQGECSFPVSAEVMALFIQSLDNGVSEQLTEILFKTNDSSAEERIIDAIDGFTFALSKLLNMDSATIEDITLAAKMKRQYLTILRGRTSHN